MSKVSRVAVPKLFCLYRGTEQMNKCMNGAGNHNSYYGWEEDTQNGERRERTLWCWILNCGIRMNSIHQRAQKQWHPIVTSNLDLELNTIKKQKTKAKEHTRYDTFCGSSNTLHFKIHAKKNTTPHIKEQGLLKKHDWFLG